MNPKPPGREKTDSFSTFEPTTPSPVKENPRKRRRSELFSSTSNNNKENISVLPPGSDLFSPTTIQRTNEKAQRGILAESSPPRPSLLIPAGLTRLESPNKPMNAPIPVEKPTLKEVLELIALDEEGGGRRTSRTRKQVNYALPNLKDKMRREGKLEERVRSRSKSLDRSVTPEQGVVWTLIIALT
jgi:Shugoshin C terminus